MRHWVSASKAIFMVLYRPGGPWGWPTRGGAVLSRRSPIRVNITPPSLRTRGIFDIPRLGGSLLLQVAITSSWLSVKLACNFY